MNVEEAAEDKRLDSRHDLRERARTRREPAVPDTAQVAADSGCHRARGCSGRSQQWAKP